ncbi:MAG: GNAT family N-acetyltransferase [Candidatus Heimdallarchaeota archaeon]|nr:GNAT family N-acetyltransferase [Candidatus Heimdallarchaeota archaeon]
MANKYSIVEFDPIKATDDELLKLFEMFNILFREREKDEPLPSNEFRFKNFRHENPNFTDHWFIAKQEDREIGFGILSARKEEAPNYEENKHVGYFQLRIISDFRRKGIGTDILKLIIKKATEKHKEITTLQSSTIYESGFEFCEKLNGILAMESAENRCKFEEVDWDLMKEWTEQGQNRAKVEGRYLQWFDKCPEDIIEPFCNVYTETMNQQPLGELETKAKITPESRRKTEQMYDELNFIWHTVISREKNGAISGITDISYNPSRSHRIEQELTGVKEEYRGKGLGKWLKAEMLFFIRKKYPHVKFISTGNADSNAAMLSINNRMGFRLHHHSRTYKFKVSELEKKIKVLEN